MAVNIRRDLSDPFYRYKMPLLQAKIEGSGNGIKTNITNLKDVAKALSRPNNYPFKYFGYELGAQVIADEKNNRFIITGAHDAKYLQDILDGFINKFVLCGSCKNPETDLIVVKKDILKQCKACGAATKADMVHSLASFIIKSQPDIGKKSKKDKKAKKEDEDEITKEAALLPSVDGRDDLDDFAGSTTAEAIMARRMDLADAVAGVSLEENVDPLEVFADFITSSKTDDLSSQLIISKVESLGIREDKACAVLAQVLWDENILKEKQVSLYSKLFEQFIDSSNSKSSQKCEKALIGSIERLVAVNHPELLPRVALVFKDLYQFDLVSEETFLSWDKSTAEKSKFVNTKQSTAVREKAVPFINWLKEAEEEDEESD